MKKFVIYLLIFLVLSLLTALTVCQLNKQNQSQAKIVTKTAVIQSVDQVREEVKKKQEAYKDPKWATLRFSDFKNAGRIYMQYDQKEDQTYVWVQLNNLQNPDNKNFHLYLIDEQAKDEVQKTIDLGKLYFDKDNTVWSYYVFPEKGNFYHYLKAQIRVEGENVVLLEANFNKELL
ncbi:hypothetical protein GYA19_02020 [Candidatus Beckwithbacteria bacterium]|nr:hypothetical protein [Candidatus Beckwithbacteria bacterium]